MFKEKPHHSLMIKEDNKYVERFVKRQAYFYEITLDIDRDYFINEIEKKLIEKNLNYKTNVKGKMTAWNAFKEDKNFQEVCKAGLSYLRDRLDFSIVEIKDAWGIKIEKGDSTVPHDHRSVLASGILYLTESRQPLIFPDLNLKVFPKIGSFVLFSSWLTHFCEPSFSDKTKYAIPFNLNNLPENHHI